MNSIAFNVEYSKVFLIRIRKFFSHYHVGSILKQCNLFPRLELSNNRAERSIKPFVIDRKNFLFANTPKGATGSAIMFSMIQTAIENGLDPYRYLTWLLKTANNADLKDPDIIESLLPWNAPGKCIAYTK